MGVLHTGTFLGAIKRLTTGGGFLRQIPIEMNAPLASSGVVTDSSGVAYWDFDTADEDVFINIALPLDYDNSAPAASSSSTHPGDVLKLIVWAIPQDTAVLTNVLSVTHVQRWRAGDSAVTAELGSSVSNTIGTATLTKYEFDLSGLGLQPGDSLTITLSGTTISGVNDGVFVQGALVEYRSNLVNTNDPR